MSHFRPATDGRSASLTKRGVSRLGAAVLWLALGLSALPTATLAADTAAGPTWSSLSRQQQAALAPLQQEWAGIDASRKAKWLEVAERFGGMPPEERARVQQRMADWARMTPTERGRARAGFQEMRQLAPADRQAAWDAYQALPPDQREDLARKRIQSKTEPRPADERKDRTLRPATPTDVRGSTGATTRLVTRPPAPPPHQQSGLPKVAERPDFVNPQTLLPQRGAQGAATLVPMPPLEAASDVPRRR